MSNMYYTDYEATVIYLTMVFRFHLAPHSTKFRQELKECPEFEQLFEEYDGRHSIGSVSMRWNDFRTAVSPELRPTRGARLPQIRRVVTDWAWLTGLNLREDLDSVAA